MSRESDSNLPQGPLPDYSNNNWVKRLQISHVERAVRGGFLFRPTVTREHAWHALPALLYDTMYVAYICRYGVGTYSYIPTYGT